MPDKDRGSKEGNDQVMRDVKKKKKRGNDRWGQASEQEIKDGRTSKPR